MLFNVRELPPVSSGQSSECVTSVYDDADTYSRKRNRRLLGAQATLLAATLAVGTYWADVTANKEIQASSEASVDVYEPPLNPENDSSAVIFFNGFGTYDADVIAKTFGPGIKDIVDGESWSINYGNAPLNTEKIAQYITHLAEERAITTIDIVGYSAGGVIGIDTAAKLSEQSDLTIRSITAVSTPDGINGLRPYQKKELESAELLAAIPGAQYSTAVRLGGEIYFMRDRFDKGDPITRAVNFGKTAVQASQQLSRPKIPGTWLLVDQTLAIADAKINENLEKVAKKYNGEKPLPTLLYLGTAQPGRDYMVDNEHSSQNICTYATENGVNCLIYDVPGAVHTMPEKTADAYTETFHAAKEPFQQSIQAAHERLNLSKLYTAQQLGVHRNDNG